MDWFIKPNKAIKWTAFPSFFLWFNATLPQRKSTTKPQFMAALYTNTKAGMNQKIDDLKRTLLSTDYPRWRNIASSILLVFLCTTIVGLFVFLYLTKPLLQCYEGYLYFAIIWLICEYMIIIYLYAYNNIPSFARTTITMVIGFSNIWFGLFVFGLQACVV